MEEKQLNFNQPLLSVRRFSSTIASEADNKRKTTDNSLARRLPSPLPSHNKSELKSGPVRNAGAVPFVWEKTPGKPKHDETKLQQTHAVVEQSPVTPNLPPGRVPKLMQQDSDVVTDKRIGNTFSNSQNVESLDKKVMKHESSKEGDSDSDDDDDDDGDGTYQDAVETLSRTESFFMSGYDDQEVQVQQQNGSFSSSEQQARDFMIDRFLPAAKAMISETPQYASKKTIVGQGQQKQMWKIGSTEKSSPLSQHRLKLLQHKEGSVFESDDSENYSTNTAACGLFSPFCLLNPMPGVRMANKVQNNASCNLASSHIETTDEQHGKKSEDSKSDFTKDREIFSHEKTKQVTNQHRRGCGESLACESTRLETSYDRPIVEKTLYVDSVHNKIKFQTSHKGDDFGNLQRDSGNQGSDLDKDLVSTSSPQIVECKKIDDDDDILIKNYEFDIKSQSAAKWIDQECNLASFKMEDDGDGKIDLESQCGMKLSNNDIFDPASFFEIPLVLSSLKAPSESWLKRTLPAISTRNTSSHTNLASNIYSRSQIQKTASVCNKCETIVNSSYVQHDHLLLREELLKPIAEED
ncbi:uncharacterized protein [Cicer arietinum]|uniref:Uncharacterized protein LOC101509654 isoform X1 n=1 Tax=Cicer arietinum TaxID=3827 RepID=A0A1S2XCK2_CICAR|nr:uncharacterized protein LOC101509654 isoform X1 [Cicer arietinum]XP_027191559.1 uncharacterized protein LOC101509654 isoform X1 [Cicer arietinum]XP_027191561.1 uncharacterized protein LOC101509654 isoform X1 [Cicer arietinum]